MSQVTAPLGYRLPNADSSDLGPYHGRLEGYSRINVVFLSVMGVILLAGPWLLAWVAYQAHHQHQRPLLAYLPISLVQLCIANLLGFTLALAFWQLWKRLSQRVAQGGQEAAFFDGLRHQVTSLVLGLVTLLLMTLTFVGTHH